MHRAVRPYLGLKASLSSLPGWQELRIITLPPRFYSVHSFGYVAGRGGGAFSRVSSGARILFP